MDERQLLLVITERARRVMTFWPAAVDGPPMSSGGAFEAFLRLREALDNYDGWQAHANEPHEFAGVRQKTCELCGLNFFFAQLPGGRWVPFDPDPIRAENVDPDSRYVVKLRSQQAEVIWEATGDVYLDHRYTCPARELKIDEPAYLRRYKANLARMDREQVGLLEDLQAMRRQFKQSNAEED